ncbi:restriction endonuclease subunit S [Bosea sp. RAF48]|uniref:restriction endonuclease subunit S n=1 Tax=Bosea sp. RAF48 TaxID=3237480 RepID=UPI003F92B485
MSSKRKSSAATDGGAALPERRFPEFHEAGAWDNVALGSVASIRAKKVGDKKCVPMSVTSGVGLVSQMEKFGRIIAGDSYKNYLQIQKNDFAYNKSATKEYPEGFIALYTGDELAAVPNSIFTCFRVQEDTIWPSYLNYLFLGNLHGRWLRKFIEVGARAHGSLSINDRDLLALPVPVPSGPNSLKEQQKIADCLKSADALIAAQGRKVEALKAHKNGLMQQLFPQPERVENGIKIPAETRPRLRFPAFEGAGEWAKSTIGGFKPFVTSGSRGWAAFYADAGEMFIRITNLSRESIYMDLSDKKFVQLPSNVSEGIRTQLKTNDLLISITADIGIIGYVDERVPSPAYINQHIALVRFEESKLCSKFVAYFLASDQAQRLFHSSTDNGTKAGMNLTTIQNIGLMVPSIEEQQSIADCLTSVDELIAAETRRLETFRTYKKGLMQQLFPQVREAGA